MIVREILAKSILSKSGVYEYVVNPYVGCQFACTYCYARFMKRFTGHKEPWGEFVDVKINASELLKKEIIKKKKGRVWMSGVCDPYQPLEKKYRLTRQCIEILVQSGWRLTIQTKSPLVLRDVDLLKGHENIEAGFTITTGDDAVRQVFEPDAPTIIERVEALSTLHKAGITTYAMIAPMLPGAEKLAAMLKGTIDYVLIDRMNYHDADWVYKKHKLIDMQTEDFFNKTAKGLFTALTKQGIKCQVVFQ